MAYKATPQSPPLLHLRRRRLRRHRLRRRRLSVCGRLAAAAYAACACACAPHAGPHTDGALGHSAGDSGLIGQVDDGET